VFVIAATNRPDIIDIALLRPGRLDKILYVPIPTKEDRVSIMKTIVRKSKINPDVNIEEIAKSEKCNGFSGADLNSLVKEAALSSMKRSDPNSEIN